MNVTLIYVYGTILTLFFVSVMIFTIIVMYIKTGQIIRNISYIEKASRDLRGNILNAGLDQSESIKRINETIYKLKCNIESPKSRVSDLDKKYRHGKTIKEKEVDIKIVKESGEEKSKIEKIIMDRLKNIGVSEKEETLIDYEKTSTSSFLTFDDETEINVLKKPGI